MKSVLLIIGLMYCWTFATKAQEGAGSFESGNGLEVVSADNYKLVFSESLYLGPNADWYIEGEVHVYSRQIYIASTAKISGSGTLYIHSPGDNPFYDSWADVATDIDANNCLHAIDVNIVLTNPKGLRLSDISYPNDMDSKHFPPLAKAGALRLAKPIDLRVDGANIFLNGFDLEMGEQADILHHSSRRMVVTGNSVKGHLIKDFVGLSTWLFPVGKEEGDYTPALLTPSQANSKIYVSVTDYLASGIPFADETIGMDRVWNIYADRAMTMTYTLIHNMSSNGMMYVDADAQIVQNADGGNWVGDVTLLEGQGIHTRKDIETRSSFTLSGTWFTKLAFMPPTAVDDEAKVEFGDKVMIHVLHNDSKGSASIVVNSVRVTLPPVNGTYTVENGSIVYKPYPKFVGEDELEYEITDENGLTSKARVRITVMPRELMIPNVITPNGDGKNDKFVIVGAEAYDRIDIVIVNRWGNEVYRNTDYKDEWSGNGLNQGTYYYIIRGFKGNDVRVFKGWVLIKRQ
ncbi:T9SS type B sorting domain-containing protein [Parapusillimonas sp. SGNA-6]|uniref:T9SS type B sorting domain-containing protein n=1 Tax=Parapedobacter sp. SGR-10 TaxID=2710879 RepID=UPI0013D6BE7F|nr:gliding motility-associated C-terminal domain-containing protein [Parapedobacter sp. SGR-10]NGF57499.1 T9SS type B sorting domain-containing protein [Parapedobacter sp. SGR-10]NGM89767.1 T9SS type B sorting domain-containing protein [Parapusillimonas sp. SGNA-6]